MFARSGEITAPCGVADQPLLADRVEERTDVGIEDPVHLASCHSDIESIQRLVLTASGSEPIAEPQKLRLIDRRENGHHRPLDDLVLKGGDAERPLSTIRLRYILPPRWVAPDTFPRGPAGADQ